MFGLICLLFSILCDFKDMYIGKGMPPASQYYGKAGEPDTWHRHLERVERGEETWTTYK